MEYFLQTGRLGAYEIARGVEDVFFVCVDALKGSPEAIETVYPYATVPLCIGCLMLPLMKTATTLAKVTAQPIWL